MIINLNLGERGYDIVFEHGVLNRAGEYLNLERKVLVVTDSGVPAEYAEAIMNRSLSPVKVTVEQGEKSKNFDNYKLLLETMLKNGFTRSDCVAAVGGGVVGDLAGFAAATYMRGVDFYNVPTTVLSQVDSSIGGKTAIDFGSYKNTVGAFYQPKKVLIDPDTLKTLPARQISNGLAESVKMAVTFDGELFEIFESENPLDRIDDIIIRSLLIKKAVVEKDEKEAGLRRALNFGHTIGHAIETARGDLYHGECVAAGMIPMSGEKVKERLIPALEKLNLPVKVDFDREKALEAVSHDKKADKSGVIAVISNEIGSFEFKEISGRELESIINSI